MTWCEHGIPRHECPFCSPDLAAAEREKARQRIEENQQRRLRRKAETERLGEMEASKRSNTVDGKQRRQKWYAIAEPIRGVYDSWKRCQQALEGKTGVRCGPVEVSSAEEGWAILDGGVRLDPGLYAFTDANDLGGVGVVIVRMAGYDGAQPEVLCEIDSSVMEVLERAPVPGLKREEAVDALTRMKQVVSEMVAPYEALNQLLVLPEVAKGSEVTIVHDNSGVAAWMQAEMPPGSTIRIVDGYADAVYARHEWRPAREPVVSSVVRACWELASRRNLKLAYRYQPRGRSEAAGEHHFARFNGLAHKLAERGSRRPPS
jgi:hypothetical protein